MTQIITSRGGGQGGGGGGDGDMKKAVYDPQNIGKDAFDYDNFTNTPTIPTEVSELDNDVGYITSSALSDYQTTSNLVTNLTNPDDTHYPSAKAVSDAISGGGAGDMLKSVYDPNNVSANAFDYNNFINTPTIPTDTSDLTNGAGYITGIDSSDVTTALGYTPYNSTNPNGYVTSSIISNTAYGSGWNGDTTHAPTKDAVYDKIDSVDTAISNKANTSDVLTKTNTVLYTPSADYNPATKKYVDDAVGDLIGLGKFLSLWDATTGQPISFPLATPYTYTTGDYYLVSTVSTATPPVNYKPTGSSYSGTASTTTESEEVEVGDIYIYDGTNWLLQLNHGKAVSFSEIAGSPSDNTNLSNALNDKQDDFYTASASQPVSPAAGDQWYDTTNQVLKVYNGSSWEDIGGGDAKVFAISDLTSAESLATAMQAYTYAYTNKKGAIINYSHGNYVYAWGDTSAAYFTRAYGLGAVSNGAWASMATIKATVSSGSVTALAQNSNLIRVSSSVPSSSTSNNTITLVI